MKKSLILIFLIVVASAIIISVKLNYKITAQDSLIKNLNDSLSLAKNQAIFLTDSIRTLNATLSNKDSIAASKDSVIKSLKKVIAKQKKVLNKVFTGKSRTQMFIKPQNPKSKKKVYPIYSTSWDDEFSKGSIRADKDSVFRFIKLKKK